MLRVEEVISEALERADFYFVRGEFLTAKIQRFVLGSKRFGESMEALGVVPCVDGDVSSYDCRIAHQRRSAKLRRTREELRPVALSAIQPLELFTVFRGDAKFPQDLPHHRFLIRDSV